MDEARFMRIRSKEKASTTVDLACYLKTRGIVIQHILLAQDGEELL